MDILLEIIMTEGDTYTPSPIPLIRSGVVYRKG